MTDKEISDYTIAITTAATKYALGRITEEEYRGLMHPTLTAFKKANDLANYKATLSKRQLKKFEAGRA